MADTRPCHKCGKEKPLEEFAKSSSGKYGRRETCKGCINRRHRKSGWQGPSTRLPSHVRRSLGW